MGKKEKVDAFIISVGSSPRRVNKRQTGRPMCESIHAGVGESPTGVKTFKNPAQSFELHPGLRHNSID